jgi:hypothetical protein
MDFTDSGTVDGEACRWVDMDEPLVQQTAFPIIRWVDNQPLKDLQNS